MHVRTLQLSVFSGNVEAEPGRNSDGGGGGSERGRVWDEHEEGGGGV